MQMLNTIDAENMCWRRHTIGAASLIEARGPDKFETEFEKGLLLAQAGPLVSTAITTYY